MTDIVKISAIRSLIFELRGEKVMFDFDLAELYGIETKYLKRAVRRNPDRFPADFMFELTKEEFENLRSQIGTSSWGGTRYPPMAFTEQGVAMLSSVLNSERAVKVNVAIMRTFVALRKMIASHADLVRKIEAMEKKYDGQFAMVFKAIKELMAPPEKQTKQIGFDKE
jgi:hypothetical protein